jgi:hypothetical protein
MKTKLVILLLALNILISCNKDIDNEPVNEYVNDIIGTWLWTSTNIDGNSVPLIQCEEFYTTIYNKTTYIETEVYGDNCELSDSETLNYVINGNIITATIEGESFEIEIISINETTLVLQEVGEVFVFRDTFTKQ